MSEISNAELQHLAQADLVAVQRQLKVALTRFELVNESTSEGLWDMEYPADGNIGPQTPIWWSDQLRKLLGYSDERDFPNVLDSWSALLHPNDVEITFSALSAHLLDKTGRTPFDREYQLKCNSGSYRWFRARGTTLRDKEGNPLRLAGSLRDITDEKRKAIELQAALTRFDLVNQSASEGLWDMEYPADGNIGPQTPFWSPQTATSFTSVPLCKQRSGPMLPRSSAAVTSRPAAHGWV